MKTAVVALIVLSVAGLIYLTYGDPNDAPSEVNPELSSTPALEAGNAVETQVLQARGATTTQAETRFAVEAPAELSGTAPGKMQQGVIILVDDAGEEFPGLDGTMELTLWDSSRPFFKREPIHQVVSVEKGRFVVGVNGVDRLQVDDLLLAGKGAYVYSTDKSYEVSEAPLVLRALWTKNLDLHVRSKATREHLSEVTVIRRHVDIDLVSASHPGGGWSKSESKIEGDSPLRIDFSSSEMEFGQRAVFIKSRGFAWRQITADTIHGGEREVLLEPGGRVSIALVGDRKALHLEGLSWGPKLRLYDHQSLEDFPEYKPHAAATGWFSTEEDVPIEIEGLAPGIYQAVVQERSTVVGEAEILVVAGEQLHYELPLVETQEDEGDSDYEDDDDPDLEDVGYAYAAEKLLVLTGEISGLAAWGLVDFKLKVDRLSDSQGVGKGLGLIQSYEMDRLAGDGDAFAFSLGDASPGRYRFKLASKRRPQAIRFSFVGILEEGQAKPIELELPPPAQVFVQLVNHATGEIADVDTINWNSMAGPNGAASSGRVRKNEDGPHFEFLVAPSEIVIGIDRFQRDPSGFGYEFNNEPIEVFEGRNDVVLQFFLDCGVQFQFLDSETHIPIAWHWDANPKDSEGGDVHGYSISGQRFDFPDPGSYLMTMPKFPDYEPVPDQRVTVERGKLTTRVVQLVRLK